jgi:MSHA biogenesis protein MshE
MTGHLVLSTLHTNDAVSTALRLIDMGAEAFLISAVMRGIMAQRLVRRNCIKCTIPAELTPSEAEWLQVAAPAYLNKSYVKGTGCNYCHLTGVKGQIGVFELLEWNSELTEALRVKDFRAFNAAARRQETYKPLILSGLDLAVAGITTVNEVMRISDMGFQDVEWDETLGSTMNAIVR